MHHEYSPVGVCSTMIEFDITDGKIFNLKFTGGCNGNLKAIGILTEGMDAELVQEKLSGNSCGGRPTSCADQLAIAIKKAREKEK